MVRWFCMSIVLAALTPTLAAALEHVSLTRDGKPLHLSGEVVVEAEDGGLLFRRLDGTLWLVQPEEIGSRKSDQQPFVPAGRDEIAKQLSAEMGVGFRIHHTANYILCYNTSPAYAQWCGALYERLFKGFYSYWKNNGVQLHDPDMPLVALVFDSRDSYGTYARRELGGAVGAVYGYYNMLSNRVVLYDLTGIESGTPAGSAITSAAHVNRILSQPQAEPTVATIVHEATHQLAFNSGLQVRLADLPFWVNEGIAAYFETPDLRSSKGWRGIGGVNRMRMADLGRYLPKRPENSLVTLLSDDTRFRDPKLATDAYAEAWALNYYLLRTRSKEYVTYLQRLAQKKPLIQESADDRLTQFKAVFGADLKSLDDDFIRYVQRLR